MTPFDLFQRATCEIADGDRAAAVKTLQRAIRQIDKTGTDADMRADLVALLNRISKQEEGL